MGIADGKRALIVGVANDKSLAWSIAQELHAQGAELALTYQGEILEKRVRPLAAQVGAHVVGELDVSNDAQHRRRFRERQRALGRSRHDGPRGGVRRARGPARPLPHCQPGQLRALDGDQRLFAGRDGAGGGAADGGARRRRDRDLELPRRGARDSRTTT